MNQTTRSWGRSGIATSALGLGCWAVGGEWNDAQGNPLGWGRTDDTESVAAVRRAVELGITFFDTADVYGAGHSERLLGRALAGRRDQVILASKWGNTFDEQTRTLTGSDASPEYVRTALVASLRRLGTEHLDLYQLHLSDATPQQGARLRDACEDLVAEGLIRAYAWSTDDPERAEVFAAGAHCAAIQFELSVLHDATTMVQLCEKHDLAGINRTPLAMGVLTGKYDTGRRVGAGDIRATPPPWLHYFADGTVSPKWRTRVEAVRDVLTGGGRTLPQGALAWVWGHSERMVPIPGFRTVAQVEENAAALRHGPLSSAELAEIDRLLSDD